jgi:hypothetical protein
MKLNIRVVATELVSDENNNMYYKTMFEPVMLTPTELRQVLESLNAENMVIVDVGNKTAS